VHIARDCYFNVTLCNVSANIGERWRDDVCL
jgi:hypothetical protein